MHVHIMHTIYNAKSHNAIIYNACAHNAYIIQVYIMHIICNAFAGETLAGAP